MVYYFTSNTVSPSAHIYVGKDKVESTSHLPHPPPHHSIPRCIGADNSSVGQMKN